MGFAADLDAQCQSAKRAKDSFCFELVGGIGLSLLEKSAVGDPSLWKNKAPAGYVGGRFKANWMLGVGEIDYTTTTDIDPDGGATFDRIVGSIPKDAGGGIYFITNSLPYAYILENGHHSSQVPPGGMVGLTVIELQSIAQIAASKVSAT